MLDKLLIILSIIGIVMSIISILIKGMDFIALAISNAIAKSAKEVGVNYRLPFVVLFISTIIFACAIAFKLL